MKKFLKDTRGVVMMEYIMLGCLAIAVTAAAVLALGNVYCNGLQTMGWATLGQTQAAASIATTAEANFAADVVAAGTYANAVGQDGNGAMATYAALTAQDVKVYAD